MWEAAPTAADTKLPAQVVEDLALCLLQVYWFILQQCTVNRFILTVIIELMRAWEVETERKLNRNQA